MYIYNQIKLTKKKMIYSEYKTDGFFSNLSLDMDRGTVSKRLGRRR